MNWMDLFFDPVLRAPTLGTLFMCIASSLIGVVLFLQKKTLLSESLSHATYPGVVIGVTVFGLVLPNSQDWAFIPVLVGAFLSSLCGLKMIGFLQNKKRLGSDASLCLVLALFFGLGIVATSILQTILPSWQNQVQMLLFGQAATMTDSHIVLYGLLALLVSIVFYLSFHSLQAFVFDRDFSLSAGLHVKRMERILFWLLLLSLILGIRSVGVVLMSGMVIAPAVIARQFTNRFSKMLILAPLFGALSGLLGNALSVMGTLALSSDTEKLTLPTGPMIVLVGGVLAFLSLTFAPKRGLVFRKLRVGSFRLRCLEENILKMMWKKGTLSKESMKSVFGMSSFPLFLVLRRLLKHGWIEKDCFLYQLTPDGRHKASFIVRLHRLWELYLSDQLKLHGAKVHKTAEEMEHIITPDLEKRLTCLLSNPTKDPHHQPIPKRRI
jgi:manganese/zinc/iron transport system permease protein